MDDSRKFKFNILSIHHMNMLLKTLHANSTFSLPTMTHIGIGIFWDHCEKLFLAYFNMFRFYSK